jgi:phosphoglycolate phosphatase-like HAD superfamily hydrolase
MKPTVLLYDIDGTLVTTGGAGRRALVRALQEADLRTEEEFSFAGMTDRAILRRYLNAAGGDATEERIDALLERYVDVLREEVERTPRERYFLHEGALDSLQAAEIAENVVIGLGTGNVRRGAQIKLEAVGVWERFAFGGFGCDAEDRAELLLAGAERGAAVLGRARVECRVVVIGDTPRDIAAAKAIGAETVAVATGRYGLESLAEHRPTHAIPSLSAPRALSAILGRV